jgi:hypothetical protein
VFVRQSHKEQMDDKDRCPMLDQTEKSGRRVRVSKLTSRYRENETQSPSCETGEKIRSDPGKTVIKQMK